MADFNTIHIFGFGHVQIISKDKSITKKASDLTKLQPVIDDIWAKKPSDTTNIKEYHVINIFNGMFVDWLTKSKDEKNFRLPYSDLNQTKINALINELNA